MMKKFLIILFSLFVLFACQNEEYQQRGSEEYIKQINEWHKAREERLKENDGWLNLVGLYWLKPGENTFGSDKSNDIVFPEKAPAEIGKFVLSDSTVTVYINNNVDVMIDSQKIKKAELKSDITGEPNIMSYGSLRWFLIKRGKDKYGIRLRDLDAPLVKNFKGIERFPVNDKWRIEAKFKPYPQPKEISIPTVIGTVEKDYSPGKLVFSIDGKEYSLEPTKAGSGLFIVFADETSGVETYGAGRFLYTDGPDSNNIVVLDFNKAYNPPCAFTKYATCPMPPKENKLKIRITAGEKKYGEGH